MFADKTVHPVWPCNTIGIRKLVADGEQVILTVLKHVMRTFGLIVYPDRCYQRRK